MPEIPDFPPAPRSPRYRWDSVSRRFRAPDGRYVSAATVRGQLDAVLDGISAEMRGLSAQLRAGEISLSQWQTGMMGKIKEAHLTAAVAERGGWAQMTQADFGRVGRAIRDEYGYLRNFAADIASGKVPLDGRLDARAALYGQAGRSTYHRLERQDEMIRGMTQERRVLGMADHCEDCIDYAGRGWQPIGTLPPRAAEEVVTI
jgi:hypothetical protein